MQWERGSSDVGGQRLVWERSGEGEALLLVMGLGSQMVFWPDEFCAKLVRAGYQVIRYDNRDIGLSGRREGKVPLGRLVAGYLLQRKPAAPLPYGLTDMAGDAAGLLEDLRIDAAHIVGVSMGGMIAQQLAITHPKRVKSLASIMSSPGGRWVGHPTAMLALLQGRGESREEVQESTVRLFQRIGGSLPIDADHLRHLVGVAHDRGMNPAGFLRQLGAVLAADDRREQLKKLQVPTVVIHGTDDPLVPIQAGRATAEAIPGARWVEVPGMGHCMPPACWPALWEAILENVDRTNAPLPRGPQ
jgi:pimeloyl-ACP methyl ester carboxylesterase